MKIFAESLKKCNSPNSYLQSLSCHITYIALGHLILLYRLHIQQCIKTFSCPRGFETKRVSGTTELMYYTYIHI